MISSIKNAQTLSDIQGFLKENHFRIEGKEKSFLQDLVSDWDDGLLSKKLVDLKNSELAKRIDKIDPNQTIHMICQDIYKIICFEEEVSSGGSGEPFRYDIGETYTSSSEWSVYL